MATVWRAVVRGAAGFTRPVAVKKMRDEFRAMVHSEIARWRGVIQKTGIPLQD